MCASGYISVLRVPCVCVCYKLVGTFPHHGWGIESTDAVSGRKVHVRIYRRCRYVRLCEKRHSSIPLAGNISNCSFLCEYRWSFNGPLKNFDFQREPLAKRLKVMALKWTLIHHWSWLTKHDTEFHQALEYQMCRFVGKFGRTALQAMDKFSNSWATNRGLWQINLSPFELDFRLKKRHTDRGTEK